jgi:hypothetical protein
MICTGDTPDTMIGGYSTCDRSGPSSWISAVSVDDVDGAAARAVAAGGRIVEAAHDIPGVGRRVRVADPQGAELYLFRSATGDPPDADAPLGGWCWNELHTTDPAAAVAFYEQVVGFGHVAHDMGPGGTYHILSASGADRGGVTHHLAPGVAPHWLPYVHVDDADQAIARARTHGGTIPVGCEDIPGIGRFGVIEDPTGGVLAVLKPLPRQG